MAGNGSQWAGMAADLLKTSTVFRLAVEECAAALQPYGADLLAEFAASDGFSGPIMAAAGLTAVQVLGKLTSYLG